MSTLKANAILDASGGSTATINGVAVTSDNYIGMRNRIINGDMRIDQRNAGASVSINDVTLYTVDRWNGTDVTDGVFTVQQNSSAPTGFVNSIKITTTTSDASLTTTQAAQIRQEIEGTNVSDLAWGTANAKTVTLSFWVRSSLTGTFGGSLRNGAVDRSYPFSYSISVADTWEYKTVTIPGDTTGTWLTNNETGLRVTFGLGAGPDRSGTAGSWAAANYASATGAVSVIGTLNATWYITGVQLEVGSVATPFERRPYGTELALCQRYYYLVGSGTNVPLGSGSNYTTTSMYGILSFPVTMRIAPTISSTSGTNYYSFYRNANTDDFDSLSLQISGINGYVFYNSAQISGTAGHGGWVQTNNASAFVAFTAEL